MLCRYSEVKPLVWKSSREWFWRWVMGIEILSAPHIHEDTFFVCGKEWMVICCLRRTYWSRKYERPTTLQDLQLKNAAYLYTILQATEGLPWNMFKVWLLSLCFLVRILKGSKGWGRISPKISKGFCGDMLASYFSDSNENHIWVNLSGFTYVWA